MSDNWVVQNLQNALGTWNAKLAEIWLLVTQSPEDFKGGAQWDLSNTMECLPNSSSRRGIAPNFAHQSD